MSTGATKILITQCLQNDFVKGIKKDEPLPNLLHIGYHESLRLLGENPKEGPVAQIMKWAHAQPDTALRVIHIRDWHSSTDHGQEGHLHHFGRHCIQGTAGAEFVFETPKDLSRTIDIVNTLTLNDFEGTNLGNLLDPYRNRPLEIGLIGVWTEAKITFLAYEILTRYPHAKLAVCSALTASSTRSQHFYALTQLERILGVRIIDTVGEFIDFLGGETPVGIPPGVSFNTQVQIQTPKDFSLPKKDYELLRYLFRNSKQVQLEALRGGHSGNSVLLASGVDNLGRELVPYVVKLGPRTRIGKERAAFERIEPILGNHAPTVSDFADYQDRGGIKYRYAAMGRGRARSFQELYKKGASLKILLPILDEVFLHQLGKLTRGARIEQRNLFQAYTFSPKLIETIRSNLRAMGESENHPVVDFYKDDLPKLLKDTTQTALLSSVHGDLNASNILTDSHGNVWLIDFTSTDYEPVLKDLIKFENDLLYILTPITGKKELTEAKRFTKELLQVKDLSKPPKLSVKSCSNKHLKRSIAVLNHLRSYYPALIAMNPPPRQLWIGQLRYAIHTLSFDESSLLQKQWALHTAAQLVERLR